MSPFRQSPTSHLFRSYLFNGYRRLAAQLPYWIIPVGIGVFILSYFLTSLTKTWNSQVTACMRGLRREMLGRTARRVTWRAHPTR
jgi:hypothetical protein